MTNGMVDYDDDDGGEDEDEDTCRRSSEGVMRGCFICFDFFDFEFGYLTWGMFDDWDGE